MRKDSLNLVQKALNNNDILYNITRKKVASYNSLNIYLL